MDNLDFIIPMARKIVDLEYELDMVYEQFSEAVYSIEGAAEWLEEDSAVEDCEKVDNAREWLNEYLVGADESEAE